MADGDIRRRWRDGRLRSTQGQTTRAELGEDCMRSTAGRPFGRIAVPVAAPIVQYQPPARSMVERYPGLMEFSVQQRDFVEKYCLL